MVAHSLIRLNVKCLILAGIIAALNTIKVLLVRKKKIMGIMG